jgi:hypothetical protein
MIRWHGQCQTQITQSARRDFSGWEYQEPDACYSWYIRNEARRSGSSAPGSQIGASEFDMKKSLSDDNEEMRPSYDFSNAVRGKHAAFPLGAKVVTLEPDVAELFPDSAAVNQALRALTQMMAQMPSAQKTRRRREPVSQR